MSSDVGDRCPGCGVDVAAGARFCSSCGTPLAASCPGCGAPASGRFCAQCGTPLTAGAAAPAVAQPPAAEPVAERRLTSVLFGDLVGFTPLSESRDPEQVREILSRYFSVARTVIQRYGGTVEKFIGDAVMAVWGVPTAQEDDAERSVRAGMDLVDAVAALGDEVGASGLSMRVGIVTGEVAATIGATGEGMVAGDAVNTAARIQSTAAPGEVWVDPTTRSLTAAAVSYTDAGLHALKGKSEPIALFAARQVVAAVGGAQRVDGLEAPFGGRDREMRLVKELFHATFEERRPRLVAVTGTAGVGKSRLGWEFFKYVDGIRDLVRWHRGRCLSYGDGVAFWALAEAVRGRLEILEGDDTAVVVEKLQVGLERWIADPEERSWLTPRLATLLNVIDAVAPEASFGRDDLFASWQLFFERLAGDDATGIALLIEDLQWADDGLLDFIEHLLTRSQAPIFILALARPDLVERRPSWGTGRRVTPMYLEPLGDAAMAEIIDGLVEGLPERARTALVTKAEGIPLFAVETVRALIDRDAVVPQEGRYVYAGAEGSELDLEGGSAPTSLHTLIAARLDALTPDERRTVQNAAVLGLSFSRRGLEELMQATSAGVEIDSVLEALVRKEILTLESDRFSAERGQYRFVQAMVRSVAYDTLARRDRKARHLQAAAYLSEEADADSFSAVLAAHLIDARDAVPDDPDAHSLGVRAVDLLERAALRAAALGAPVQALKHLELALSLATDDATVGRLATHASQSARAAGRFEEQLSFAERAVDAFEAAALPVEAAIALASLGDATVSLGGDAIERLTGAFRSLETQPMAARALIPIATSIARSYVFIRSEARTAFDWWESAIELSEAEEDWDHLAEALSGLGVALLTAGRPTMGLGMLRISLDVARDHELQEAQLLPLNNLAAFLAARDVKAARAYVEEGLALASRLGHTTSAAYLAGTAMHIYWLTGTWDDAMATASAHTDDLPALRAVLAAYICEIARARGLPLPDLDFDDASNQSPQFKVPTDLVRASHLLAAGDSAGAVAMSREALDLYFEFGGYDDDFPVVWSFAVDTAFAAEDVATAATAVRLVDEAPRGRLSTAVRALLPYFRARVSAHDAGRVGLVEADFEAAELALRSFGAPYWLARCLLDHAEWLARDDRGPDAVELAREATEIFDSLGAQPWVRRCSQVTALALR